jgi:hypothetical protein
MARLAQHSRGQVIRTMLVLLDSLLLSRWFSSGIAKTVPVGSLAYHLDAGLSNFGERRTRWANTLCPMN